MSRHRDYTKIPGSTKPVKFRGAVVNTETSISRPLTPEFTSIDAAELCVSELLKRGNHWHVQVVIESSFTGPSGVTIWNTQMCMNYPRKPKPAPEHAGEGI